MNSVIRIFNYRFLVKEFLIVVISYLLMEQIFAWLIVPSSSFVQPYLKISQFAIYGTLLFLLPRLSWSEKIYVVLFTLLVIKLVLESLYKFDSFFQQLTMFYVLFPVIYVIFIKYICRTFKLDLLEFMAKFYLAVYFIFMVLYGRGFSFNLQTFDMADLGVFSGDGRIIHATSVFMMIMPLLWYLNKYIHTRKTVNLLLFLLCCVIIFIHQHRSVWSCAIFSLLVYLGMSVRVYKSALPKVIGLMVGTLVLLSFVYFFMSAMFPEMIEFFGKRFNEIFDVNKTESTGHFRMQQREVYFKLFLERPLFGWSFEGFEMSNPIVDWWPEKTGQHFHEGFMEILFYQGVVGLLLKYSFLLYLAYRSLSKRITDQTIVLIAFCLSGLLFSLSYVPQNVFWGHVGLCLYYLELDDLRYKVTQYKFIPKTISNKHQLAERLIDA